MRVVTAALIGSGGTKAWRGSCHSPKPSPLQLSFDLLDVWPRKIYFFPRSGKVMVKRLRKINNDTIVLRERDYGARLFHAPVEGGAELFK